MPRMTPHPIICAQEGLFQNHGSGRESSCAKIPKSSRAAPEMALPRSHCRRNTKIHPLGFLLEAPDSAQRKDQNAAASLMSGTFQT
jgi:hypothetical protein